MYRALLRDGEYVRLRAATERHEAQVRNLIGGGSLMSLSLFALKRNLFLYFECIDAFIAPGRMFPGLDELLEPRPGDGGSRTWIAMADIFHFSRPLGVEHWRRKERPRERVAMAARIKPDMLSSYIYHHYVLQESQTSIVNKYCMIGLDENLIFYYEERPVTFELAQRRGALDPSSLGPDWQETWQELMTPHFLPWEDAPEGEEQLRRCENILECFQGFD